MCTNVAAAGKSVRTAGAVYIGSVSDDPYDIRTRVVVERTPHAYAYLGTDLVPLSAATSAAEYAASTSGAPTRGLNECGLAFTWAYAWEKPENKPPPGGLKAHQAWGEVMRSCATVDEAIVLLGELQRDFGAAGMLADRNGHCALVEIGRRHVAVSRRLRPDVGGTGVNVNCWMAMQDGDGDPRAGLDIETAPNRTRYSRATERLGLVDGSIGLGEVKDVLCDHGHKNRFAGENTLVPGHGFSVCNHGSLGGGSFDAAAPAWGSVSAEIIDPVDGVFWYAYGWPCGEAAQFGDQMLQERSWGRFVGFRLADLPAGQYSTLTGELTPLAMRHFDRLLAFPG
jgi:acyl-CoA:6-aminopenicillanic acid acyl transferase